MIGFFLETKFFQIPAAASITIFFAVLIGVSGAFAYFLQSWSIPYLIGLIVALNVFYKLDWIDPRNKAYGINYTNKEDRPAYSREALRLLCNPENVKTDSLYMIDILENWKKRQPGGRPLFTVLTASGGGNRSATFTMKTLQQMDSVSHGEVMKRIFLITGSSGGMIGAAYFRELYFRRQADSNMNLQDRKYVDDIAGDLLNPLFSSFVARDLISPAHKFKVGDNEYVKDRAYAFEHKLNENTRGFLNRHLGDYKQAEQAAGDDLGVAPLHFHRTGVRGHDHPRRGHGRRLLPPVSTDPARGGSRTTSERALDGETVRWEGWLQYSNGVRSYGTIYVDANGKREEAKSVTEEEISGALIRALKGGQRTVCAVTGTGEHSLDDSAA
ncbi:MAG: hypothetical protein HC867_04055, partial [Bacteroidia bacterium]|nr:hypothetical protein [Bacteroidia bacterium]